MLTAGLVVSLLAGATQAAIFQDTFDRSDNTDLNASTEGQSGDVATLIWDEPNDGDDVSIQSNKLFINGSSSTARAMPEHSFTESTTFSVQFDTNFAGAGGNNKFGLSIGHAPPDSGDLSENFNFVNGAPALGFSMSQQGSDPVRLQIQVFEAGTEVGVYDTTDPLFEQITSVRLDVQTTGFNDGTAANASLYLNGSLVTLSDDDFTWDESFEWIADDTNYIVLEQQRTDGITIDNFTVTPEPATLAILGLGGLGVLRRRRN
jgi:hypothetical protein